MTTMNQSLIFNRGLKLKNRLVMAPMTTKMSFYDGVVTSDEIAYYGLRAGEVGAIITGAANVQAIGKGWEGELGVYDDKFIPGLSKLAAAIKKRRTKAILQLYHGGRMTDSSILRGKTPVAPSAIPAERPNAQIPQAFSHEEILALIEDFKKATQRAIDAGFNGVELHGANTHLIQQFFSPHSNRREDQWGGTREKRFRFIDQLIKEITSVVDQSATKNFIVGYRFSPEEFEEPGIKMEDTLWFIDQLADQNLDYLHISMNDYKRKSVDNSYQDKSILAYIHDKIAGKLPLIGVGDIRTGEQVNEVLEHAELTAVGRSMVIDPHWAGKILSHKEHLIRKTLSSYDFEELFIGNGILDFLYLLMPERIE